MADALLNRLSALDTCVVSDALDSVPTRRLRLPRRPIWGPGRSRPRAPITWSWSPTADGLRWRAGAACYRGRRVAAGSGGAIVDGACRDVEVLGGGYERMLAPD